MRQISGLAAVFISSRQSANAYPSVATRQHRALPSSPIKESSVKVASERMVAKWRAFEVATKNVEAARDLATTAHLGVLANHGRPDMARAHKLRLEHRAAKQRAENAFTEQQCCKLEYERAVSEFYSTVGWGPNEQRY